MIGATASLATTSAEDLRLFKVERVRLLTGNGTLFSDKDSEFKNSIGMLNWIGYVAFETILAVNYHVSVETDTKPSLDLDSGPKYWSCTGPNT